MAFPPKPPLPHSSITLVLLDSETVGFPNTWDAAGMHNVWRQVQVHGLDLAHVLGSLSLFSMLHIPGGCSSSYRNESR